MRSSPYTWLTMFVFALLLSVNSKADEIRFGFTGPLSGPSGALGQELVEGIELGFARMNASAQFPFKVSLIARDDGYEPSKTPNLVRHMVEENRIIGLVGSVGTPTTISAIPVLQHYQLPLVSPITGSNLLQQEGIQSLIFTHRASYHDEAQLLAKTVAGTFGISPRDMAVYIQQDSYGEVTLRSLTDALKAFGLEHANDLLQIHYVRNQPHTEQAVAQILSQPNPPKAIFLISTFPAASELIRMLDGVGVSPLFAAFSFVSHETLNEQLEQTAARVLSTQLHPCFDNSSAPIIQEFTDDIHRLSPSTKTTSVVLEGYMAARRIEQTLLASGFTYPPTKRDFLRALKDHESALIVQHNVDMKQSDHRIWLELHNHQTQKFYCGDTLPEASITEVVNE
ncbi:MAG: hypothetical protein DSY86_07865 [Marinomonas sp.]|nr:MAG: hypothetical protein DSY86_07865 [Marinomonas sp.]